MISKLALTALLGLAVCAPVERAAAQANTLGGAIFGGVAGAIVGGALGGNSGAAAGAVLGAATGAAIGAQGEPRPGGYRYYQNGCYVQEPDGSWVGVSPRYCQTAQYAPKQQYYDEAPACTRYRSYNPRSGTYIGRDGYQRPCP
jgi:hypothetical protein